MGAFFFGDAPLPSTTPRRFLSIVTEPPATPNDPPSESSNELPREPHTTSRAPSRNATNDAFRDVSITARGLALGAIAGAALLGFLIGVGRRAGTAFRPLNATAHTVFGTRADGVWGFDGIVTAMGSLEVLVLSAIAGIVVARLAPSLRTLRAFVAAAGVALAGYLLHLHVAARASGGLSALLSLGELRALYVTLAIALVAGMRFAFSPGTNARQQY